MKRIIAILPTITEIPEVKIQISENITDKTEEIGLESLIVHTDST
jgi:hypothetical protein